MRHAFLKLSLMAVAMMATPALAQNVMQPYTGAPAATVPYKGTSTASTISSTGGTRGPGYSGYSYAKTPAPAAPTIGAPGPQIQNNHGMGYSTASPDANNLPQQQTMGGPAMLPSNPDMQMLQQLQLQQQQQMMQQGTAPQQGTAQQPAGTAQDAQATDAAAAAPAKPDPCAAYMASYDSYVVCQDRIVKLQRMQDAKAKRAATTTPAPAAAAPDTATPAVDPAIAAAAAANAAAIRDSRITKAKGFIMKGK